MPAGTQNYGKITLLKKESFRVIHFPGAILHGFISTVLSKESKTGYRTNNIDPSYIILYTEMTENYL